ncbi:MAG: hypothetical protein MUF45_18090 [Spirosomaceae bacterium]|nr:hypothetical protein [Spirosomataceae bacterium]
MKNKPVRQYELEQLGEKLNEFFANCTSKIAKKLNLMFQKNRKKAIYLLILFGIILLSINILSFYYF